MNEFLEKMGGMAHMPKAIRVEVFYDAKLQEITGVASEPVTMNEGATFGYLLKNIFMAHPEMMETYPPGTLGIAINGYSPKTYSPMLDGDRVLFTTH